MCTHIVQGMQDCECLSSPTHLVIATSALRAERERSRRYLARSMQDAGYVLPRRLLGNLANRCILHQDHVLSQLFLIVFIAISYRVLRVGCDTHKQVQATYRRLAGNAHRQRGPISAEEY